MLRWISLFVFIIIQNAFEKWKKNTEKGFWWTKTKTHSNPAIRIGATSNILLSQIKVTVPSELSAWCLKNALIIWNANISNSSLSRTVFTIPRAHFPLYLDLLQKIKQKETTPNSNFMCFRTCFASFVLFCKQTVIRKMSRTKRKLSVKTSLERYPNPKKASQIRKFLLTMVS